MNRFIVLALSCFILTIGVFIKPAKSVDLETAVAMTLSNNPAIKAAISSRETIGYELQEVRGLFAPTLEISASVGYNFLESHTTGTEGITTNPMKAQATVVHSVFDAGERYSRAEQQKHRYMGASLRIYERSEFLALAAVDAYLEVLEQRELLKLASTNIDFHRSILEDVKERQKKGIGDAADVSQIQARLSRSLATASDVQRDHKAAEANYLAIVGEMPHNISMPSFPEYELHSTINGYLRQVHESNPTLSVLKADSMSAKDEVYIADSLLYPRLNIEANASYNAHDATYNEKETSYGIVTRLRWQVSLGGSDVSRVLGAKTKYHESLYVRNQSFRNNMKEAMSTWYATRAAMSKMQELEKAVFYSRQTRDAYQYQFELAQRSLLDLLDSENELFVIRGQLITARTDELFLKYRMLALAGGIVEGMGLEHLKETDPTPSYAPSLFF